MAFTVRPDEAETDTIKKAAGELGTKSMSKAVIMACSKMLSQKDELERLEYKTYELERRAKKAESVIAAYQNSQSSLMGFNMKN